MSNENNNLTVWQRLSQTFGPNSLMNQDYPVFKYDKKELLKTTNAQEYERAKLQAQQTFYLANQWTKIENNLYSQGVYFEPTRLASYYDYESMEYTPEISAALDIYAEESTTADQNGFILQIYSESKRIKSVLADLFNNVLDINTNLAMWTRNTCKYGDNFVYLKLDPEKGIVGCMQLPNIEIERVERGMKGKSNLDSGESEQKALAFNWKNKDMSFNTWEIAHFRLLGDDRKLPYGTCLKGDTRINTEFGVKEIKDIEIGDKVWSFNTETQEKELSPVLDKVMSGTKEVFKISTKHNYVDASKEHKILISTDDGEFLYKNVCDLKIGDLLVINKNERTNRQIKINKTKPEENKNGWFNDIDIIPEYVTEEFAQFFGFLIGDGWIPTDNDQVTFALGTDDETNEYYISLLEKFSNRNPILHDNKQVCVNSKLLTTILKRMGFNGKSYEKRIPEWVYEMDVDYQKAFVAGLMDADGWATRDQWTIALHIELCNKPLIEDLKILLQRIGYKSGSIRSRLRNPGIIEGRQIQTIRESHLITFYDSYVEQMKKYDIKSRKTDNFILEPIQSIESTGEFETYDIYVENDNHNFYANNIVVHNSMLEKARRIWKQLLLSEDAMLIYRTSRAPERRVFKVFVGNMDDKDVESYVQRVANKFKRDQVVDHKTGNVDMRFNQMAVDQDYFVPVRDPAAQSPIDTLPGATNLSEIADIEYIQKKLLTALRVPKAFLGFEEVVGDGKNLSLQDIRFARTINRIQKSMLAELNKVAIIHLFLLGFEDELSNFTLTLSNPSTQADLLKIDVWKEKMLLYKDSVSAVEGIAPVSVSWAKKHILGFSDEDIRLDLQQQRLEKAVAKELENTPTIIVKTGIFDNIDKLYGSTSSATAPAGGETAGGPEEGGMTPPPSLGGGEPPIGGGAPPSSGEGEITPESVKRDNLNILLESQDMLTEDSYIDLSKGQDYLGDITEELNKLLNKRYL
jgi:intein/homing endonuclease